MNLKRIVIAVLFVLLFNLPVFAGYLDNFTKDSDVKAALTLLQNAGAQEVFSNLEQTSAKIAFYDLSQLSGSYMNHFAINGIDSFGNRFILINTKFRNATPEEIACLIAHESFHKSDVATYDEEYTATKKEAYYWNILKRQGKVYRNSELLARLENLSRLRTASTSDRNLIEQKINSSNFYRNQLASAGQSAAMVSVPSVVLPTFDSLISAR